MTKFTKVSLLHADLTEENSNHFLKNIFYLSQYIRGKVLEHQIFHNSEAVHIS